jgi:hypothetical protein
LADVLQDDEFAPFVENISDYDTAQAIADLVDQPIVWFNGRSEIGPRALGNRSILADPRSMTSKITLNRIKQRQWWRPVAPTVLEEKAGEWFENARPSPFMLETFNLGRGRSELIPAVLHLDNTARVQTVNPSQNPALYELIQAFEAETGIPMLCNTSLNDRGEPIVNRLREGINLCLRKGVRVGYFNRKRVCFKDHENYGSTGPDPRQIALFARYADAEITELLREHNPHDLDRTTLELYAVNADLRSRYDLRNERHTRVVARWADLMKNTQRIVATSELPSLIRSLSDRACEQCPMVENRKPGAVGAILGPGERRDIRATRDGVER